MFPFGFALLLGLSITLLERNQALVEKVLFQCWAYGASMAAMWMATAVAFSTFMGLFWAIPKAGPLANPYWLVALAFLWDIGTGFFGHFLEWFTLFLTFPHKVTK